jgi:hypothetical protein
MLKNVFTSVFSYLSGEKERNKKEMEMLWQDRQKNSNPHVPQNGTQEV